VRAEPWLHDELIGIAAPGSLALDDGRVTVEQLAAETLLVRERESSSRVVAERALARAGYHPANRWELDSNEAIKRSVRGGLGIGFASRLVVAEELERGELEAFAIDGAPAMRHSIFLLRADGRDPVPAERAFIESLNSCCRAAGIAGCCCSVEPLTV
jgi:DNA-binding transcriptional LysR family regulator